MSFRLITWNIQWGRGCDGRVDLARIVATARALGDFDVLCLQEVADNFPEMPGSRGEDQPRELAQLLPGYEPVFAPGTDLRADDGARRRFGNMILSRLPVLRVALHLLPWPADAVKRSMQRVLVEAVIAAPWGPVRAMTTHLEYYSARQRAAQCERILELHAETCARADLPPPVPDSEGPFRTPPPPKSAILTADFNFRVDDPMHARLAAAPGSGVPALRDAWEVWRPGVAHPPSLGLYDKAQWPGEPFCCDFIYVTEDLAPRVRRVHYDAASDASDHQPVLLELAADH